MPARGLAQRDVLHQTSLTAAPVHHVYCNRGAEVKEYHVLDAQ